MKVEYTLCGFLVLMGVGGVILGAPWWLMLLTIGVLIFAYSRSWNQPHLRVQKKK